MIENLSNRLRVMIMAAAVLGLVLGPSTISNAGEANSRTPMIETIPVIEVLQDREISPQRAMTGTGKSAGAAAGQTRRGRKGFLSTPVIIGVVVAAATVAVAIKATSGNDSVTSTTTTN